ncbi:MMPL family transporter [Streptomyces aidingensis]|uniref:Putative drug exporter of the RND superfamily n=1 Tax=Streptomyces aidingensis TaxID=910347 RepID=A0A1I1HRU7_9ACTN|nr:MMPL family transporter [Streptomyces aidingensis]SFC26654.1 putative drug exporter of the RND superfamily [Streptomyces aidingensis]
MTTPVLPTPGTPPRHDRGSVFARLAAFSYRRRWAALLLWVVVLAGTVGAASAVGDSYRDDHSLPGTESQRAFELLREHSPQDAGDTLQLVLHDPGGVTGEATRDRVGSMLAEVGGLPGVAGTRGPYEGDGGAVSADGTIAFATVVLDGKAEDLTLEQAEAILDTGRTIAGDGLRVELGGDAARRLSQPEGGAAEGAGIMAALVILVFMFGTVIAAGLPVISAVFAVGSTVGLIVLASHVFTIASYTPYTMMLVGLGVGIDYALLIFARFRGELLAGTGPELATRRALDAAGRTVFFAGCTVIVALLGLVALGLGSLQGVALAVALTVAVTMATSLTLLPALLGMFGDRFARQFRAKAARRAARGKDDGQVGQGGNWRRVGAAVQRRPVAALLAAVVSLTALALPATGMRLGFADAGNDPVGSTSRAAYDLLAEGFGPGFNGPLVVAVSAGDGTGDGTADPLRAAATAVETLAATPGVARAFGPVTGESGEVATVILYPETAPQDEATADLVRRLRGETAPALAAETGAEFLIGGATAAVEDFSGQVADRMPLFVAIVVGVSVVLLTVVFRSVLIPLKAAVLNLLSIGASLGAITLVFQHGMLGMEPGPVEAFVPVMIFAIVFGLSMDYEVFLVSRIHEEWELSRDPARAVREGLAHTGGVITAAGAIMVVVFGAFMLSGDRMLQQFGFGLATAIFIDAVIIRCLVVPAVMQLLGRRAWWLPAPLARTLPRLHLGHR